MYIQYLVLKTLTWLICHKTKTKQTMNFNKSNERKGFRILGLVWFYAISTILVYLKPNPFFYTILFKQFTLA